MNPFVKTWSIKRILKKGRLTGCMILIALVMAPLVCALIFSESMMAVITNKYIYLSDGHIQISEGQKTINNFDITCIDDYAISIDEVTTGYALMYSSTNTCSIMIKGVDEQYFNQQRMSQIKIETSNTDSKSNVKGICISKTTAKKLGVTIGDRVALMVVPDNPDKVLRPVLVRIDGLFSSGYDQLDQYIAFLDIEYAKTLYSMSSSTSYEILIKDQYVEDLRALEPIVGRNFNISYWDQNNVSVYENFITSKQMILIILILIVCVAAFYTASVAQQMIQDDINEIAIAKLIGASDKLVKNTAFISIYTVTIAGMLLGIVFGIIIGINLGPILTWLSSLGIESFTYYLLDFKITIPWLRILIIGSCLLIVSLVAIKLALRKTKTITPIRLFS